MPHTHIDMSAQLRASRALEMRVAGKKWKDIASACGYASASRCFEAANNLLAKVVTPNVEDYRKIEDMRLDALWEAVYPKAVGETVIDNETGAMVKTEVDLDAVAMLVRISARRSKLHGLDAKTDQGDYMPGQVLIREIAAPVDKV